MGPPDAMARGWGCFSWDFGTGDKCPSGYVLFTRMGFDSSVGLLIGGTSVLL